MPLIVRLATEAGRTRVEFAPSATLGDLEAHVRKLGVQAPVMTCNGRPLVGNSIQALANLGVTNGAQIQVQGSVKPAEPEPAASQAAASSSAGASAPASSPPASAPASVGRPPSAAASATAPSTSAAGDSAEKKDPTHVSFEAFLRSRRFETGALAGALRYEPIKLEKGRMNKMPMSVTLQHQKYRHVDHIEYMNTQEIRNFVDFWRANEMCVQRCGLIYGYYRDDPNYDEGCRAVLDFIYEPPQESTDIFLGDFIVEDEEKKLADRIADRLGLEFIGWIFTSLPTDELLTSYEVYNIGKLQLKYSTEKHYTKYSLSMLVTCKVTPDLTQNGAPHLACYMISDQCTAMIRDGLMQEPNDHRRCRIREGAKNELLPTVLESGRETADFDPDWFVVRVNDGAPKKQKSLLNHAIFPIENRPERQSREALKQYFRKVASLPQSWARYADFHLLLYLAREFDVDTVMDLCDCIRERKEVSSGTEDLIKALLSN
eukprot:GEMP01016193.1.p1 GENE.GEMP01016193.1~~GEMP01016193.1.p1  ORF type:complete len:489 (+),score=117.12 GEMP01016193.1:80-1546(+)